FVIHATAAPGHTTDEVVAAIDDVLRGMPTAPPTAEELAAIERTTELRAFDALEPVLGKAELAQRCSATWHEVDCLDDDLGRFRPATPESVGAAEQHWLLDPHRFVLHILPVADTPPPPTPAALPHGARVKPPKAPKPAKPPKPP